MTETTTQTRTDSTTHTLDVPGAKLTYDVRSNPSSTAPVLLLIGCPQGASGFDTLAGHFADRTVVTYDPRGIERSTRTDELAETPPALHADDVHRLITELGAGPVDMFASSGGAVNSLDLVARHPEDVRTLVAHEPPISGQLPDRDAALAACRDIHETYLRSGMGPAMAKFIAIVTHQGPITNAYLEQPAPDPAMFGLPTEDDGSRNDLLLGQFIMPCNTVEPDYPALSAASTRVIIAAGAESGEALARRSAEAIADRLGTPAVFFPSDHGGFLGGEYGQMGKPDEFAAKLREVLGATS